jgi:hypothetical protein
MSHNWSRTQDALTTGSIPAFKAFFALHPLDTLRSIGYTWEWGQPQAAFYCVANTKAGIEAALLDINRYRSEPLSKAEARETIRWDAGYFPFPGGLTGPNDELGRDWEAEAAKLHAVTEALMPVDHTNEQQYEIYSKNYDAFLASLITTCCEALAEIASQGHFSDFSQIDFYVGSTDEIGDNVRDRNTRIRQMIAARK